MCRKHLPQGPQVKCCEEFKPVQNNDKVEVNLYGNTNS